MRPRSAATRRRSTRGAPAPTGRPTNYLKGALRPGDDARDPRDQRPAGRGRQASRHDPGRPAGLHEGVQPPVRARQDAPQREVYSELSGCSTASATRSSPRRPAGLARRTGPGPGRVLLGHGLLATPETPPKPAPAGPTPAAFPPAGPRAVAARPGAAPASARPGPAGRPAEPDARALVRPVLGHAALARRRRAVGPDGDQDRPTQCDWSGRCESRMIEARVTAWRPSRLSTTLAVPAPRAQFVGFGLGYRTPAEVDFLNQKSLLNASQATMGPVQNNVYANNPNAYVNHLHDDGFIERLRRRHPPHDRGEHRPLLRRPAAGGTPDAPRGRRLPPRQAARPPRPLAAPVELLRPLPEARLARRGPDLRRPRRQARRPRTRRAWPSSTSTTSAASPSSAR